MKIFQLNLTNISFLVVLVGLGIVLPSLIIESIWNSSVAINFTERDLHINALQASLLWGSLLTTIYMSGIFKIQIDLKKLDNLDLNNIDDPELKDELQKLKKEAKEKKKDSDTQL